MIHKGSTQKGAEALTRHVRFCFKVVVLEVTSVVTEVNNSKKRFSIAFFFHQLAVDNILHFYGRLKNIASLWKRRFWSEFVKEIPIFWSFFAFFPTAFSFQYPHWDGKLFSKTVFTKTYQTIVKWLSLRQLKTISYVVSFNLLGSFWA